MDLYTHAEQFEEALGRLTEETRYQDTVLVCQDESVRACRLLLALAFPLLDKVLEARHLEDEVCILLPDHSSEDINLALNEFFTDMSSFSSRKSQKVDLKVVQNGFPPGEDNFVEELSWLNSEDAKNVDLSPGYGTLEPLTNEENVFSDDVKDMKMEKEESNDVSYFEENSSEFVNDQISPSFEDEQMLETMPQVKTTDETRKYMCDICNKAIATEGNLNRHKMRKHGIAIEVKRIRGTGKYLCDVCNKPTASQGNLNLHKKRKHGIPMARNCPFCREVFQSIDELKEHKKRYYSGDNFKCPEENCSTLMKLTNRTGFMDHLNRHWDRLDYACEECGKVFAVKAWLTSHMSKHSDPTIKPFICHVCSKSYKNNQLLRSHMETHINAERFKCEFCGKGFPFKGTLTEHLVCHTKEKRMSCSFCDLMFARRSEAAVHMARVHTGVRKHKCSYCEKTFVESSRLKRHVRIHTGEMPFRCSKCGKLHNQRENRNKHQDSCTGTMNSAQ